jgi:hypothetical protein
MTIVLGVFIILAALAVLAATTMVLLAEWRGFRSTFQRMPRGRRPAAFLAAAGSLLYITVGAVLLIASPLGTVTWLVLFGAAAVVLVAAIAVSVVARPGSTRPIVIRAFREAS